MASRSVICVIEPHAAQFVGAVLQWRSLVTRMDPINYTLCVVSRGGLESRFVMLAKQLGLPAYIVRASPIGRYFNKWEAMIQIHDCEDMIVMIDWDVIAVRYARWPAIEIGEVAYRPNSWDLHRASLRLLGKNWRRDEPPMNSGVVIGAREVMCALAQDTLRIGTEINTVGTSFPDWEHEQLSASLAAMSSCVRLLPSEWNATPTGDAEDSRIVLWHYNDGDPVTRRLKTEILIPSRVSEACELLSEAWPSSSRAFLEMYECAASCPIVRTFLRDPLK